MKKLFALLFAAITLFLLPSAGNLSDKTKYISDGTYYFYVEGEQYAENAITVRNGADSIIRCRVFMAESVRKELHSIRGESMRFNGGEAEVQRLVDELNLDIRFTSRNPVPCIYGYSASLGEGVVMQGKKINCEIAVSGNVITVGYPVILGDY